MREKRSIFQYFTTTGYFVIERCFGSPRLKIDLLGRPFGDSWIILVERRRWRSDIPYFVISDGGDSSIPCTIQFKRKSQMCKIYFCLDENICWCVIFKF